MCFPTKPGESRTLKCGCFIRTTLMGTEQYRVCKTSLNAFANGRVYKDLSPKEKEALKPHYTAWNELLKAPQGN